MANGRELAIIVRGKDEAKGTLENVGQQLKGIATQATQAGGPLGQLGTATARLGQDAGSGAAGFARLTGAVALGTVAANAFSAASSAIARQVAGLGDSLIGANSRLQQASVTFKQFTGDATLAGQIVEDLRKNADITPFDTSEVIDAGKALISSARGSREELKKLIDTAEVLAAIQPEQGLKGAAFALKEAMSGDFTSVIERFNISREAIRRFKEEGKTGLEVVTAALKEMGADSKLVEALGQTFEGRRSTVAAFFKEFERRLGESVFDQLSEQLGRFVAWIDGNGQRVLGYASNIGEVFAEGYRRASEAVAGLASRLAGLASAGGQGNGLVQLFVDMATRQREVTSASTESTAQQREMASAAEQTAAKLSGAKVELKGMQDEAKGLAAQMLAVDNSIFSITSQTAQLKQQATGIRDGFEAALRPHEDALRPQVDYALELESLTNQLAILDNERAQALQQQVSPIREQADMRLEQLGHERELLEMGFRRQEIEQELAGSIRDQLQARLDQMSVEDRAAGFDRAAQDLDRQRKQIKDLEQRGRDQQADNARQDKVAALRRQASETHDPKKRAKIQAEIDQIERQAVQQRRADEAKRTSEQVSAAKQALSDAEKRLSRDKERWSLERRIGDEDKKRAAEKKEQQRQLLKLELQELDVKLQTGRLGSGPNTSALQAQGRVLKAEQDRLDYVKRRHDLEALIAAIPHKQAIDELKVAEQQALRPLEDRIRILDREREKLELLKGQYANTKKNLDAAIAAQNEMIEHAPKPAAKTGTGDTAPTGPGAVPTLDPEAAKEAGKNTAKAAFDGFEAGLKDWVQANAGRLAGSLVGGLLGASVLGPLGAVAGALLGGKIGEGIEAAWRKASILSEGQGAAAFVKELLKPLGELAARWTEELGIQASNIKWDKVWNQVGDVVGTMAGWFTVVAVKFAEWLGAQVKEIKWKEVWANVTGMVEHMQAAFEKESVKLDWEQITTANKKAASDMGKGLEQQIKDANWDAVGRSFADKLFSSGGSIEQAMRAGWKLLRAPLVFIGPLVEWIANIPWHAIDVAMARALVGFLNRAWDMATGDWHPRLPVILVDMVAFAAGLAKQLYNALVGAWNFAVGSWAPRLRLPTLNVNIGGGGGGGSPAPGGGGPGRGPVVTPGPGNRCPAGTRLIQVDGVFWCETLPTGGGRGQAPSPRADGGPVERDRMYRVGERGPELFVSSAPGSIIANDKLVGRGGVTISVTVAQGAVQVSGDNGEGLGHRVGQTIAYALEALVRAEESTSAGAPAFLAGSY